MSLFFFSFSRARRKGRRLLLPERATETVDAAGHAQRRIADDTCVRVLAG